MPKRAHAVKGAGRQKGRGRKQKGGAKGGKMKGAGVMDYIRRLPGALLESAPQFALGAATDNPYFMAQGVSRFAGKEMDDDRFDPLNNGPAGEVASSLGAMRMWRGPRKAKIRSASAARPLPDEVAPPKSSLIPKASQPRARAVEPSLPEFEPTSTGKYTIRESRITPSYASLAAARARAVGQSARSALGRAGRSVKYRLGSAKDKISGAWSRYKMRRAAMRAPKVNDLNEPLLPPSEYDHEYGY